MVKRKVTTQLWDYGLLYEAKIIFRISGKDGRIPLVKVTGDTLVISEWVEFRFHDFLWYWEKINGEYKLSRWISVSHLLGSRLCYWILKEKGDILSITTV